MNDLFSPVKMGSVELKNRIFMAPLTRNRAHDDTDVPTDLAIEYYSQRASAGLIIAEGTQISKMGKGYIKTPGIYSDEQVAKWKEITDAVHSKGGKIFLQLWHVGRISYHSVLPEGEKPLAPSAIRAQAQTFVDGQMVDVSEPRAMTKDDINNLIEEYKTATRNADKAGFDGVEIHSANGYLLNQFICDGSNQRTDNYGGSVENRIRLVNEVVEAVLEVMDAGRVGIRLSPTGTFNDVSDSDPLTTYTALIKQLNQYKLAYVHIVERFPGIDVSNKDLHIVEQLIQQWQGFYIANGDYNLLTAHDAVKSQRADAVAFGRQYIANPDLMERLKAGAALNTPDQNTFYGGGAEGYTDYPFMEDAR